MRKISTHILIRLLFLFLLTKHSDPVILKYQALIAFSSKNINQSIGMLVEKTNDQKQYLTHRSIKNGMQIHMYHVSEVIIYLVRKVIFRNFLIHFSK
jgi:DNA replication protein DnaD